MVWQTAILVDIFINQVYKKGIFLVNKLELGSENKTCGFANKALFSLRLKLNHDCPHQLFEV
jgi:hypothetical protein